jgi:TonB-dependent receptor
MSHVQWIRRALFGASTLQLSLVGAAVAQSSAQPPVEEVVVTGTRASLSRALDLKKEVLGVVDSIAAEDIGKFPDQNVAESLQRIAGVSIDRTAGEGRFVTVRGFGPEFNNVLFNGRLLATENDGREFSFDILAPELISSAEVYKSSSAEFQEGGIGSTIQLRSARPLDFEGFHAAGSAAAKYDGGSEETTPTMSGLISMTNESNTFGALASVVYDERKARLERFHTDGWLTGQDLDFNKDGVAELTDVAITRSYNQIVDESTRERMGATLSFDWLATDALKFELDALYTTYEIDNRNHVLAYFSDPADIIAAEANGNGTVTRYMRADTGSLATDWVVSELPRDASTYQLALNTEYTLTERTRLAFDVSYSKAKDDNGGKERFYVLGTRNAGVNPTFELRPGSSTPLYSNVLSPTDPSNLRAHYLNQSGNDVEDEIGQFQVDLVHELDGVIRTLKFGALATNREKTTTDYRTPGSLNCYYCGYYAPVPASVTSSYDAGSFLGGSGLPTRWLDFDIDALVAYYTSPAGYGQNSDAAARAEFAANLAANGGDFRAVLNPQGSGSVEEESQAAYVQLELGGDVADMTWSGQVGLRWVKTDLTAKGTGQEIASITPIPGDATAVAFTLTDPMPITEKNDYDYFLPSMALRLNVTDRWALRIAGSRTLTRPTLSNLQPTEGYNLRPPDSFFSSGGNPALQPYLAKNLDLGIDYFLNDASYFSVAGFYKWIDNFVSLVTRPTTILGYEFLETRPVNANDAKVYGVELSAQYTFDQLPAPYDGFGVSANYTEVDSSVTFDPTLSTQVFNVEGLSNSANLVLFYEKGPLQVRAAYNWRDDFLRQTFGFEGQPENIEAYGQYDVSASFQVNEAWSVFAECVNLTDERTRSYSAFKERLLQLEESGRRITAGVRARF